MAEFRRDMDKQPAERVEFACRESACTEHVVYERQELPGLAYDRSGGPKTVYLECPLGHIHSYQLNR
jgi:hypothetical protein